MQEESAAILASANKLKDNDVNKSINLLEECFLNKKKLIITGVGKSGIVARKLAATFTSLGFTAIYLNPLDALHGDLGIVNKDDICLLLSNSGETNELIELLPHLKNKGSIQMSILGRTNSTIANYSDVVLDSGVDKEVCPHNLAPTASTTVAMAIGDSLAVVLMDKIGISKKDFAINHPSGQLGKKLTLRAYDLMRPEKEIKPLSENSSLLEVITQMTTTNIGSCWIKDSNNQKKLIGLITDGDLRRALKNFDPKKWETLIAGEIMTKDPIYVEPDILAIEALNIMENNKRKSISVLPVIDSDNLFKGILRLHDLVQAGLSDN